jgi:hypothetical protein
MRLKVTGFATVDVSYEVTADIPENYLGREIEYLEDHDLLPELATEGGTLRLRGKVATWHLADSEGERGTFTPCVTEVLPC